MTASSDTNPETLIAFDVGLTRTGVAAGQNLTNAAHPAGTLKVSNGRFDWQEVDRIISQWQPEKIIIGDPKTDNPHLNKAINRLKSHIQKNHKIAIVAVDETLTSAEANVELSALKLNVKRKTTLRDQVAACLILESYFASQR